MGTGDLANKLDDCDYIGEHRGLPWSKIIVISIILLFILRVGAAFSIILKTLHRIMYPLNKLNVFERKGRRLDFHGLFCF